MVQVNRRAVDALAGCAELTRFPALRLSLTLIVGRCWCADVPVDADGAFDAGEVRVLYQRELRRLCDAPADDAFLADLAINGPLFGRTFASTVVIYLPELVPLAGEGSVAGDDGGGDGGDFGDDGDDGDDGGDGDERDDGDDDENDLGR